MIDQKKICRRCLLEDMPDQAALAASVRELVSLLPERLRAPEQETRARLEKCKSCDHLNGGMCTLCGCYVQLRAAKAKLRCPDVPARWLPCESKGENYAE